MQSAKRNLQIAARSNHDSLKPQPPADLWEQLDKLCADLNMPVIVERGPGMFTATEYGHKYGIGREAAATRLRKLTDLGRVERVGIGRQKESLYRIKS